MKFLEKYDFSKEDIDELIDNTPKKIMNAIKKSQDLVEKNLEYLKGLGISTYVQIFVNFPDLFFMDHSNFKEMLDKYEKDSLVEKLNANFRLIEFL